MRPPCGSRAEPSPAPAPTGPCSRSTPGRASSTPSIDPLGYIWSVPRDTPTAVVVAGADGAPATPVGGAWVEASQIHSMQVSRDGTRVAALITVGGQHWAVVAGVVRDEDGVPDLARRGQSAGPAARARGSRPAGWTTRRSASWPDEAGTTIVLDQLVGGEGARTEGPDSVTTLVGANQVTAVRLRAADGVLFVKRGSNWSQAAAGIAVLASQQGAPR